MARRIKIRINPNSKVEFFRKEYDSFTEFGSGIVTPVYGWPEYTIEGEFEFEVEELRDYVQVEFVNKMDSQRELGAIRNRLWTYIDPGLELKVGDLVDVPSKYSRNNLAIVRELGPDDSVLADFIVKEVTARYAKITAEDVDDTYDDLPYQDCGRTEPEFTNPDYVCGCGDPECYG